MSISVVIPAYNEASAIAGTIQEIHTVCEQHAIADPEVIVVDDGSSDDTAKIAREHGAIVISHPHNIGYGRSLKDGINAATHDTIVITDADLTYPFDQAPVLLESYHQKGFDMVVGARTGKHYKESFIKSPLRKILKCIVQFAADRRIPDINSGLRVFSKKTIQEYFPHLCDTFSFTTSSTLAYMMNGKYVNYIDIPYLKRVGKTKVSLVKDSLRTLQYILQAINYYNPLKIFMLFSFLSVGLSVACFIFGIVLGWKTLISLGIGSALLTLVLIAMGLIADLLKQIMNK